MYNLKTIECLRIIIFTVMTYAIFHVVEYMRVGRDKSMLLDHIIRRKILAHVFVIRGFKGRTIAMYL